MSRYDPACSSVIQRLLSHVPVPPPGDDVATDDLVGRHQDRHAASATLASRSARSSMPTTWPS